MIYCFDIDGVICRTEGEDYENAEPNWPVIERIKALHEKGHEIRYYTGRGWGADWWPNEESPDVEERKHFHYVLGMTEVQLDAWGLPIGHVYRKPPADVYVDDRAVTPKLFMEVDGDLLAIP